MRAAARLAVRACSTTSASVESECAGARDHGRDVGAIGDVDDAVKRPVVVAQLPVHRADRAQPPHALALQLDLDRDRAVAAIADLSPYIRERIKRFGEYATDGLTDPPAAFNPASSSPCRPPAKGPSPTRPLAPDELPKRGNDGAP